MKTTTTTIACLAAALFLSGSALQANGRFEDRNERSSRCELRAELRNERRPVMGHGFHGQRAQALRLREAQLLAELAAIRAREARMACRHGVGYQMNTFVPTTYAVDRRTQNLGTTYLANQSQYTQVNPYTSYNPNARYTSNVQTVTPQYAPVGYQSAGYARPIARTGRMAR